MSDAEVPPDDIVRTALQLLPIPSHADDFWECLQCALDAEGTVAEPAPASRSVPVAAAAAPTPVAAPALEVERDPALALVPGALRRTSNALLVAVAATAVVVVALASNTLLEDRHGTNQLTSDDQASAELDALVDGARPDSATLSTMSADAEAASSDAVLAWVDDLRSGDSDDAWAAMGTLSQAHFGSQAVFEEQLTSLAEGYGMWSGSDPDQVMITPVLAGEDGTLAVVTLVGTVTADGQQQHRADAFPVRVVDGDAHLEPFAFAGEMEAVVPGAAPSDGTRPSVEQGEELVIVVPSGAEAPVLRLDDGETVVCGMAEGTELTELEDNPGQRCSYLPMEGIDEGEHTLTVAFLGPDGDSISAASLLFDAA